MTRDPGRTSDAASWWLIAAMAGACLLFGRRAGITVDAARVALPLAGTALLAGAVLIGRATGRPRLLLGATAFLQMTLFTMLGVALAYLLAARGGPLWDGTLAAADRTLGLDWPALWRAADRWPALLWVGATAYHGLTVQMMVAIVALAAGGRAERLQLAVAAAIAGGFLTVLVSGLVPAMGNLFAPAGYRHLWPSVAWAERGLVTGLRDGSVRALDMGHLSGIVSFPSYHATLPVILAWALRDVRGLRVAAPACAAVTVLATPLFGGHYGVDVLAGLLLAPAAIALAPRLVARRRALARPARSATAGAEERAGMAHGLG